MNSDFNRSRKGQIADAAVITVILVLFAIMVPIAATIMGDVNKEVQGKGFGVEAQNISQKNTNRLGVVMDFSFLLIFTLSVIGLLIGAFVINTHPGYFVFSLVLVVVLFIVGVILANTYGEFKDTPALKTEADKLTIIPFIMQRWLLFVGVISALMLIALYSKFRGLGV